MEAEVPSIGFSCKTDPLETSKCDFAVNGEEGRHAAEFNLSSRMPPAALGK
jgi:hypothetical protein